MHVWMCDACMGVWMYGCMHKKYVFPPQRQMSGRQLNGFMYWEVNFWSVSKRYHNTHTPMTNAWQWEIVICNDAKWIALYNITANLHYTALCSLFPSLSSLSFSLFSLFFTLFFSFFLSFTRVSHLYKSLRVSHTHDPNLSLSQCFTIEKSISFTRLLCLQCVLILIHSWVIFVRDVREAVMQLATHKLLFSKIFVKIVKNHKKWLQDNEREVEGRCITLEVML